MSSMLVNYHTSVSLPLEMCEGDDDSGREEHRLTGVLVLDALSDGLSYSLPLLSCCESVSLLQSFVSR